MMTTTTTAPTLTREHNGAVVPAPGVYDIDAKHTSVEFVARHLMISKVRGRFDDVEGTITVAEVPEESSVEVTIGADQRADGRGPARRPPAQRRLLRHRDPPALDVHEHRRRQRAGTRGRSAAT